MSNLEWYAFVQIKVPCGEIDSTVEEIERQTGGKVFLTSACPADEYSFYLDNDLELLIDESERLAKRMRDVYYEVE